MCVNEKKAPAEVKHDANKDLGPLRAEAHFITYTDAIPWHNTYSRKNHPSAHVPANHVPRFFSPGRPARENNRDLYRKFRSAPCETPSRRRPCEFLLPAALPPPFQFPFFAHIRRT